MSLQPLQLDFGRSRLTRAQGSTLGDTLVSVSSVGGLLGPQVRGLSLEGRWFVSSDTVFTTSPDDTEGMWTPLPGGGPWGLRSLATHTGELRGHGSL